MVRKLASPAAVNNFCQIRPAISNSHSSTPICVNKFFGEKMSAGVRSCHSMSTPVPFESLILSAAQKPMLQSTHERQLCSAVWSRRVGTASPNAIRQARGRSEGQRPWRTAGAQMPRCSVSDRDAIPTKIVKIGEFADFQPT